MSCTSYASLCSGVGQGGDGGYLTTRQQPGLLQPRPDALDTACVLRVDLCVPTHTLMLQHQAVIHQPWTRTHTQTIIRKVKFFGFLLLPSHVLSGRAWSS